MESIGQFLFPEYGFTIRDIRSNLLGGWKGFVYLSAEENPFCKVETTLKHWISDNGWSSECKFTAEEYRKKQLKAFHQKIIREIKKTDRLAQEELTFQDDTSVKKKRRSHGPRPGTVNLINKLIRKRQTSIDETNEVPPWLATCDEIGIDRRVVIKWAPEVRDAWSDASIKLKELA